MSAETLLVQAFAAQHPDEAARAVEQLAPAVFAEVLDALEVAQAAALAVRVMPLAAALALTQLSTEKAASIVLEIEPRSAAVVLLRLTAAERDRIYEAMPQARAAMLRTLSEYGADRAAGRIDPRAPMLPEALAVSEVIDRLRASPEGALDYVYAVDGERRLTGVVNLRELLGAAPTDTLARIMTRSPHTLLADEPLEAIALHPAWKRQHALPVVDRDGRLLGALRYSAFRAVESELGARSASRDTQVTSALAELFALGVASVTRLAGIGLELPVRNDRDAQR